jgi:hypothetical protein
MPRPRPVGRRLAPAMAVVGLLALGLGPLGLYACDPTAAMARLAERQARIDPPRLWLAESLSPSGRATRVTEVCADTKLYEGFARADPEVNGQPCRATSPVVERPGLYALRCEAIGYTFAVAVTTKGDLNRNFQVRYALTPLDAGRGPFVQTLRYRLVGACPAGWRIGDQSKPQS